MLRNILLFLFLASLPGVSVAVSREAPTVTPLTNPQVQPYGQSLSVGGLVGNINPPAYSISDWFWGDEAYKILFNPLEQLDCRSGFLVQTVHMVVDFDATMVPATFGVYVDLESAVWDGACYVPGPEECVSPVYQVQIDTPGTYDLAFPLDCQCAFLADPAGQPYMYLLSVHFQGSFDMNLVSDNLATPCTVYNNWGGPEGWYDLYDTFSGAGNLLIYGETVCCDQPVADEPATWSGIKGLYK